MRTCCRCLKKNGKIFAIGGVRNDPELAEEYVAMGAQFIIAGMGANYFQQSAVTDVISIRNAQKEIDQSGLLNQLGFLTLRVVSSATSLVPSLRTWSRISKRSIARPAPPLAANI